MICLLNITGIHWSDQDLVFAVLHVIFGFMVSFDHFMSQAFKISVNFKSDICCFTSDRPFKLIPNISIRRMVGSLVIPIAPQLSELLMEYSVATSVWILCRMHSGRFHKLLHRRQHPGCTGLKMSRIHWTTQSLCPKYAPHSCRISILVNIKETLIDQSVEASSDVSFDLVSPISSCLEV